MGVLGYITTMRAAGRLGRATSLERKGRADEALRVALYARSLLRSRHVVRGSVGEVVLLIHVTVLIERISIGLHRAGASEADLRASILALERLGDDGSPTVRQVRSEWLPFLRSRLHDVNGV